MEGRKPQGVVVAQLSAFVGRVPAWVEPGHPHSRPCPATPTEVLHKYRTTTSHGHPTSTTGPWRVSVIAVPVLANSCAEDRSSSEFASSAAVDQGWCVSLLPIAWSGRTVAGHDI